MAETRQALIGLGANLGDRAASLQAVVDRLRHSPGIQRVIASRVFETEPIGLIDQPRFLNQVLGVDTTLSPDALLRLLQAMEHDYGRVRDVRWGPRTLDLDLLAYENERRSSDELTLPHPRMLQRAFVLVPLRDVLAHEHFRSEVWDDLRRYAREPLPDENGVKVYHER